MLLSCCETISLTRSQLGYSALVGLGVTAHLSIAFRFAILINLQVLILGFPLQLVFVKIMFDQRKKGVKFTDARVRLTTEVCRPRSSTSGVCYPKVHTQVLQGIRLLKLYDWVDFYLHRIGLLREKELATIWLSAYVTLSSSHVLPYLGERTHRLGRSGLFMTVTLLPVLASVLSFVRFPPFILCHEVRVEC